MNLKNKYKPVEKWNENVEKCSGCGIHWKKIGKQCPVCYKPLKTPTPSTLDKPIEEKGRMEKIVNNPPSWMKQKTDIDIILENITKKVKRETLEEIEQIIKKCWIQVTSPTGDYSVIDGGMLLDSIDQLKGDIK